MTLVTTLQHVNRRKRIARTESVQQGSAGDCFANELPLLLSAPVPVTVAKHAFCSCINRMRTAYAQSQAYMLGNSRGDSG